MPDQDTGELGFDPNDEGTIEDGSLDADAMGDTDDSEGSDDNSQNDDPYKGKSREAIIRELQAEREARKDDGRFAELRAELESLKAQHGKPQDRDIGAEFDEKRERAQAAFEEEWAEKIGDIDGGAKHTIKFVQEAMREAVELSRAETNARIKAIMDQVEGLDPRVQEQKEQVDELVKTAGITRQQALAVLKVQGGKKKGVRQPGTPGRPGRTADGRAIPAAPGTTEKKTPLQKWQLEMLAESGASPAEIERYRKEGI